MRWPEPAALDETGWGPAETENIEQPAPEKPSITLAKRLAFILITLLVILSLLAPLLIPILRPRMERPKQFNNGLQANQIPSGITLVLSWNDF